MYNVAWDVFTTWLLNTGWLEWFHNTRPDGTTLHSYVTKDGHFIAVEESKGVVIDIRVD